jgi:alpha-glucosidase
MKNISHFFLVPAIAILALAGFGCSSTTPSARSTPQPAPAPTPMPPPAAAAPAPAQAAATDTTTTPAPANLPRLKFVKADSEETAGEDGKGANAVDGDPATIWHTQWQDDGPPCPHEIVIELVPPTAIKGFTYLPRQDEIVNGTIKDYEFYVSDDGVDFGQPVSKGTFENSKELKTVSFDPKKCRFIKLKALSEVNDGAWTSAAEIGVVPAN